MNCVDKIIANGKPVETKLPCSLEEFLVAQKLLPLRSRDRSLVWARYLQCG